MYSVEMFKEDINVLHVEITFVYKNENYFISDSVINEQGIYISGPRNDEFVSNTDAVLDTLLVDGRPMRDMLPFIDPD